MCPKGLPRSHRPLAELAERQHGVVSIRQLMGPLGYSRRAVSRASAAGRLHRVHQGVYAVGYARLSLEGRCLAAVLACGPRSLLSHQSAAWLWGVSRRGPFPVQVTTPVPRKARLPIAIHHSRALTAADRDFRRGIPVTAFPRTLLDVAAITRPVPLGRILEHAEEQNLFDLGQVNSLLARTVGHPGHGPLRGAIEIYREPVFSRSGLERRFLALIERAGLPRPATGFNVAGYELDVYWWEERFAVELDVFETHGTRGAFERDRLRQEDLKLAGVEMIRATGKRLERESDQVVERVARLLERRRAGL